MALFRKKEKGIASKVQPLTMHWDTEDPFVFASHHCDDYPKGNAQQAPPLEEISGRNLGRDYKNINGFCMYHGKVVPGFPMHAHWGYETVTIPEIGFIDTFDTLGNNGRYGFGDVQWLSAGSKYQHCEMYPLAYDDRRNPNDITQIMIELPEKERGTQPDVKMMWKEDIPMVIYNGCSVKIIAGSFGGKTAIAPNDVSWAADQKHVRILKITMEPKASVTLDAFSPTANRNIYYLSGESITIEEETYEYSYRLKLPADRDITITNGNAESELWVLEGEPMNQNSSRFGPVILGSDNEVRKALNEIRLNEFKEWPWDVIDKANPKGSDRFFKYADGREEHP